MKEILEKYLEWKKDKDEDDLYDCTLEFINDQLGRGGACIVMEFIEKNKDRI